MQRAPLPYLQDDLRLHRLLFERLDLPQSAALSHDALLAAVGALVREPQQAEVGDAARAFLLAAAIGESWAHWRPATRALADLGGQVEAELRRVLTEAPDPRCRQLACGGRGTIVCVPALLVSRVISRHAHPCVVSVEEALDGPALHQSQETHVEGALDTPRGAVC